MRKGIGIVVLAICVVAGTAGADTAYDLNHEGAFAGAGDFTNPPSAGSGNLKKLAENDTTIWMDESTEGDLINDVYDGDWWIYPNDYAKKWAYIIVGFVKPANFPTWGQLRWRAGRAATDKHINCYQYDGTNWAHILPSGQEEYTGTEQCMPTYYYANINEDDFIGEDQYLWIMMEVETTSGYRWFSCDVCDIQYAVP